MARTALFAVGGLVFLVALLFVWQYWVISSSRAMVQSEFDAVKERMAAKGSANSVGPFPVYNRKNEDVSSYRRVKDLLNPGEPFEIVLRFQNGAKVSQSKAEKGKFQLGKEILSNDEVLERVAALGETECKLIGQMLDLHCGVAEFKLRDRGMYRGDAEVTLHVLPKTVFEPNPERYRYTFSQHSLHDIRLTSRSGVALQQAVQKRKRVYRAMAKACIAARKLNLPCMPRLVSIRHKAAGLGRVSMRASGEVDMIKRSG